MDAPTLAPTLVTLGSSEIMHDDEQFLPHDTSKTNQNAFAFLPKQLQSPHRIPEMRESPCQPTSPPFDIRDFTSSY